RGAVAGREPWVDEDEPGRIVRPRIATYGETRHTFVERAAYDGVFAPGFGDEGLPPRPVGPDVGLRAVDHCVRHVARGDLARGVGFYRHTMGFDQLVHFGDDQIATEYSALMSTVV